MIKRKHKGLYKRIVNESIEDVKSNFAQFMVFEFLYKVLNSFLVIPILIIMFDKLMRSIGVSALVNSDVMLLGLNLKGMLGLLFIAALILMVIYIELSTLTIISEKRIFNKEISIIDAFLRAIKSIPLLFGRGYFNMLLYFLIVVPFVGMAINASVLSYVAIPKFVQEEIFNSNKFFLIYLVVVFLLSLLYARWIFTINYMATENTKVTLALKKSRNIAKGFYIRIFITVLIVNIILPIIILIFVILFLLIFAYIVKLLGIDLLVLGFDQYFNIFSSPILLIISMLAAPFTTTIITKLFYYRKKVLGEAIIDLVPDGTFNVGKFKGKNALIGVLTIMFIVIASTGTFLMMKSNTYYKDVQIAAHRGDINIHPENTMGAINDAIKKGATFIEIDLQRTKDGKIILFHDKNLYRLTGINKKVSELTYNELEKIKIKGDNGKKYDIPTFAEVLKDVKGKAKLLVEIKAYGNRENFAKEVIEILKEYNMTENTYIQSGDYEVLRDVRKEDKNIKIGYIAYILAGDILSLDVDFYSVEQTILTDVLVEKAKDNGKGIWVWTVNNSIDINDVLRYNIDGIITDNIDGVREELLELQGK